MNEATSPWNWMWLRRSASISFTFVMSWNSSSTISARKPPPSSSRSGRSSSVCSAGQRIGARVDLEPALIPSAPSESPRPVLWRNSSTRLRVFPFSCRA